MVVNHNDRHELSRMTILIIDRPYGKVAVRDFGSDIVKIDASFVQDLFGFFFVPLNHIYNINTL